MDVRRLKVNTNSKEEYVFLSHKFEILPKIRILLLHGNFVHTLHDNVYIKGLLYLLIIFIMENCMEIPEDGLSIQRNMLIRLEGLNDYIYLSLLD